MVESMSTPNDPDCCHYPATARNRESILAVLRRVLPATGRVVEVGSGSGEHGVYFAGQLPGLTWAPSDPSPEARRSIAAWSRHVGLPNIEPVQTLDATQETWPWEHSEYDPPGVAAVVAINVIHISPWETCLGILAGASRLLSTGGVLYLYGPYRRHGSHTSASNAAFDASLRARDSSWGVRDLEEVVAAAETVGLAFAEFVPMPANNFSVVFVRR